MILGDAHKRVDVLFFFALAMSLSADVQMQASLFIGGIFYRGVLLYLYVIDKWSNSIPFIHTE